jgi:hypothetical protein
MPDAERRDQRSFTSLSTGTGLHPLRARNLWGVSHLTRRDREAPGWHALRPRA